MKQEVGLSEKEALARKPTKVKRWAHQATYVRGSAVYAALLGRKKEKVSDVEIKLFSKESTPIIPIQQKRVSSIDSAAHIFTKEEFYKLKKWLDKEGYVDRKINLIKTDQRFVGNFFRNEPELLIWNEAFESGFFSNIKSWRDQNFKKYKQSELYEGKMSEKLVPKHSLTDMLMVMSIARKFDLEYDAAILEKAEKKARNGSLSIHAKYPTFDAAEINPKFMDVYTEDKSLRKILLRYSPRLGQIAEEIQESGGIEKYVRQKFGNVYLKYDKKIRLFDVKLSTSREPLKKQADFLDKWADDGVQTRKMVLRGVEKVSNNVDLPRSRNLHKLIDQPLLFEAIQKSHKKEKFLGRAQGRYELKIDSPVQSGELKSKIKAYLRVMNLDWPSNVSMDTEKVTKTLIKLGVHPKDPILNQFVKATRQTVDLVISAKPLDILHASTDKPWKSCVGLRDGEFSESLYSDIGAGAAVAYLLKDGKYLARKLIRAGYTIRGHTEAAGLEELFGEISYGRAMNQALRLILKRNGIETNRPMKTHPYDSYNLPYSEISEQVEGPRGEDGATVVFIYNRKW